MSVVAIFVFDERVEHAGLSLCRPKEVVANLYILWSLLDSEENVTRLKFPNASPRRWTCRLFENRSFFLGTFGDSFKYRSS